MARTQKRARVSDAAGEDFSASGGGGGGGAGAGASAETKVVTDARTSSKFVRVTAPCVLDDVPEDCEMVIVRVPNWFDWSRLNGARMPVSLLDGGGGQRTAGVDLNGGGGGGGGAGAGSSGVRIAVADTQCLRVGAVRVNATEEDEDETTAAGGGDVSFQVLAAKPSAMLTITDAEIISSSFLKPVTLTSRAPVTSLALQVQAQEEGKPQGSSSSKKKGGTKV